MEQKSNASLEAEKLPSLMRRYSLPCIISLVAAALYNIVDQIFIANADYLGSCGNAANTVVFPLTVVALAIAVMIGDGACAFVSISLGADRKEDAHRGRADPDSRACGLVSLPHESRKASKGQLCAEGRTDPPLPAAGRHQLSQLSSRSSHSDSLCDRFCSAVKRVRR